MWIEPRVFARQWYTDNYLLSGTDRQSEWTTELGASVLAVFNLPRLTGSVDYSLSGLYQAQCVGQEDHIQGLVANLLLDDSRDPAIADRIRQTAATKLVHMAPLQSCFCCHRDLSLLLLFHYFATCSACCACSKA